MTDNELDIIRDHCNMFTGYYYLASPYTSDNSKERKKRYLKNLEAMSLFINHEISVFSPIAHTHPIATLYDLPTSSIYWNRFDEAFVKNSIGMIFVLIDGWLKSKGMKHEFELVKKRQSYPLYIMSGYTFDGEHGWQVKRIDKDYFNIFDNDVGSQ